MTKNINKWEKYYKMNILNFREENENVSFNHQLTLGSELNLI